MSKSYAPKYVVQLIYNVLVKDVGWKTAKTEPMEWKSFYGRPTESNLRKFISQYNSSLNPGGSNAHLADAYGYIPYAQGGTIKYNTTGGAQVASVSIPFMMV